MKQGVSERFLVNPISNCRDLHRHWIRLPVTLLGQLVSKFKKGLNVRYSCSVNKCGILIPPHLQGPCTIACGKVLTKLASGNSCVKIGCMIWLHSDHVNDIVINGYSNLHKITCLILNSVAKWVSLALAIDPCQALAIDTMCCSLVSMLLSSARWTPSIQHASDASNIGRWLASPNPLLTLTWISHYGRCTPTCCLPTVVPGGTRSTSPALGPLQLLVAVPPKGWAIIAVSLQLLPPYWLGHWCKGPYHPLTQNLPNFVDVPKVHK